MEGKTIPQRMWRWVKDQIVGPVPEADALCEFDCRKGQCNEGEWANCDRRIQKASGELWPEHDSKSHHTASQDESPRPPQDSLQPVKRQA